MKNNVSFCKKIYDEFNVVEDNLLIEKHPGNSENKIDDLVLVRENAYDNCKFVVGKIVDLPKDFSDEYGLNVGDYVLYDMVAGNNYKDKYVVVNVKSVYIKLEEDEVDKFFKKTLFV